MKLAYSAGFESYGTRLLLRSNDLDLVQHVAEIARSALLGKMQPCLESEDSFPLVFDLVGGIENYEVTRNGELIARGTLEIFSTRNLKGLIRLSVAEFSRDFVFLHAGAVGWRGKGIVLPALSFNGKSTLVYELLKLGAEYYSDDLAILDRKGLLHPFPRDISMRTREEFYQIYEVHPETIGGITGEQRVSVGLIFLTKYRPRSRWSPRHLSRGEGIFEVLPFTLPIRQSPEFALQVLDSVAAGAVLAKSDRGDARRNARRLLEFFDNNVF